MVETKPIDPFDETPFERLLREVNQAINRFDSAAGVPFGVRRIRMKALISDLLEREAGRANFHSVESFSEWANSYTENAEAVFYEWSASVRVPPTIRENEDKI